MSKALIYIPYASRNSIPVTITGDDTVVDNQIANIIATDGYLLDGTTRVRYARRYTNAVVEGGNCTFGDVAVGDTYRDPEAPGDPFIYNHVVGNVAAQSTTNILAAVTDNGSARNIYRLPDDLEYALSELEAPASAPTLTAGESGSLAAGVWKVQYAYVDALGYQSLLSPVANVTVGASGKIVVSAIALPPGAVALNWFVNTVVNAAVMRFQSQTTGATFNITTAPVAFTFGNPDVPRNLRSTAGGTAGDIKAISVTVYGKDIAGNAISEVLPAFTVDTAGTKTGTKAFKSIYRIAIPAHDNTGATTAVGVGNAIGLAHKLGPGAVQQLIFNNALDSAPTVVTSRTELAKNVATPAATTNGSPIVITYNVD